MSFATDKDAVIDILKEKRCNATKDVYNSLNAYSDIPKYLFKYGKAFDGDNAYLDTLMAEWDNASLAAVGVYYNQAGGTITNPKVVIKCTNVIVNINAGGNYGDLEIIGASQLDELNITNNTLIGSLAVAGGSVVDEINLEAGSEINTLLVKSENGQNSTVTKVVGGAGIKNAAAPSPSVFGGYECEYIST